MFWDKLLTFFASIFLSFIIGWFNFWIFRKLRAKFQSRVGPPWYQPFADIIKLFGKEFFIPSLSQRSIYVFSPILSLSSILILSFLIPPGIPHWIGSFTGDLIVIIYFSVMFSLSFILAGVSSGNVFSFVGSSRETIMVLIVELPLAISLIIPSIILNSLYGFPSLSLSMILEFQFSTWFSIFPNWFIFHAPFSALALFICVLTKCSLKPFGDIPEAEQEIIAGPLTEYGGPLLGLFEISRLLRFYVFPALFVNLYLGGGDTFIYPYNIIIFLIKIFIVDVILVIVDCIYPRFRIDQAFKWYMTFCLVLTLIDLFRFSLGVLVW
ncbi:MAG: complex I subunit 1 family protein [Candidatus Methanomethylicia archaeon]